MSITQQTIKKTIQVEEPTDKYTLNVTLSGMELKILRIIVGKTNTNFFNDLFQELSEFCRNHFDYKEMDRVRTVIDLNLKDESKVLDLRSLK